MAKIQSKIPKQLDVEFHENGESNNFARVKSILFVAFELVLGCVCDNEIETAKYVIIADVCYKR